jgi:hypothetical protein
MIEVSGVGIDLINCKFYHFHTNVEGGVLFGNSSSTIMMTGCLFDDCYGSNGGVLRFIKSTIEIKNTLFVGLCHCSGRGGVLFYDSSDSVNSVSLENVVFDGTYAGTDSGVCRQEIQTTIKNCTFNNCHAPTGGCISSSNQLEVEDCIFHDCYAGPISTSNDGGGCFVCWGSSRLSFTSCLFERCYQTGGGIIVVGGAIRVDGRGFNISNCIFSECSSSRAGGAIGIHNGTTYLYNIKNTSFLGCFAGNKFLEDQRGGAIISYSGIHNYTNCSFLSCSTPGYFGGTIELCGVSKYNRIALISCIFIGCKSGKDGGGIDTRRSQITAENCIFYYCSGEEYGGAVSFEFNGIFVYYFIYFFFLMLFYFRHSKIVHLLEIFFHIKHVLINNVVELFLCSIMLVMANLQDC